MPSKGSKAASRQAKLRQKRRRSKGADQDFHAGPSDSEIAAREEATAEAESRSLPSARSVSTKAVATPKSFGRKTKDDATPEYKHLSSELKHIGVVSVFILAILTLLTFLLGG